MSQYDIFTYQHQHENLGEHTFGQIMHTLTILKVILTIFLICMVVKEVFFIQIVADKERHAKVNILVFI